MSRVEGRLDDVLVSSDRGEVGRLDPVFKGLDGIEASQIVQRKLDEFEVNIVRVPGFKPKTVELLENNLRDRLGSKVEISINFLSEVPRDKSGKFRAVINKAKHLV